MTRYVAFLSYSHGNRAECEWLHRALERYRIPRKLVGQVTARGIVPARLTPVFRDRDELAVSSDLGSALHNALDNSANLIVVASPFAARSSYVDAEIRYYKQKHGEENVFAIIVGGEPYASNTPGQEAEEAFPAALRFRLNEKGQITETPAEPIAADMRKGKDGRKLALMKLVAGITGLRLDDLVQREAQRRARTLGWITAGASFGMFLTTGLAFYANEQRILAVEQRKIAEKETAAARAATDYLIGTFELSNPATENPRTVSLVTILGRSAERARTELKAQPDIEARLVTAVGRAYNNLGLLEDAEKALVRAMPAIKRAGADGAPALLALASTYLKKGSPEKAMKTLSSAEALLGAHPGEHPTIRAQLLAARGGIAYVNGDPEGALPDYDAALASLAQDPAADPREKANILDGRGRILTDLGRYDEAEQSLQEANRLFRTYRGEQHMHTGRNLYSLALVSYSAGNYDLARERIGKSLQILDRMLDNSNPIRADALSLQGSIYQAQGKLAEAEKALKQSVDAYRQVYKGPHYNIGISEFYRAQVATKRNDYKGALQHLAEAQLNYEASYGKIHANIGEVLVNRARIFAKLGRPEDAIQSCNNGMSMLHKTIGPDHSFTTELTKICKNL